MIYDQFVGQVQHRARLGSLGDAVRAVRATLETLGERLDPGETRDLASQLPQEIGYYLFVGATLSGGRQKFSLDEFFQRIALRELTDLPVAIYHARVVFEVMRDAVSPGEMRDVLGELPSEFRALILSGSVGKLQLNRQKSPRNAGRSVAERPRRSSAEKMKTAQPLPRIRGVSPAPVRRRAAVRERIGTRWRPGRTGSGTSGNQSSRA